MDTASARGGGPGEGEPVVDGQSLDGGGAMGRFRATPLFAVFCVENLLMRYTGARESDCTADG